MREQLRSGLPVFVTGMLVLQPLMDVLSFWLEKLEINNTVTLLLRLAVLAVTVLLGFALSDRKWIYWTAAGICAALLAGHLWACSQVGFGDLVGDLTNYIRVVQMPVTVLCLVTFFRQNDRSFDAMQLGLTAVLWIMLLVDLISVLTGTENRAYANGHGILGWFNNSSSQSANMTMLVPISLAWQLTWKKRRPLVFWVTAVGGLGIMYLMCTRLAYLGLVVILAGFSVTLFLVRRQERKLAIALAALCVLAVCVLPISPLGHHIDNGNRYESGRQEELDGMLGEDREQLLALAQRMREERSLPDAEYQQLVEGLEPIYREYVKDFVAVFGLEVTMAMYDYSADILTFADARPKKIMFGDALMEQSPASARWFGVELSRFTVGENIYDVENDFHGIYYLYGMVGLAAYLLFILAFVLLVVWALLKDAKKYFTVEAAGFGIAFLLSMAHCYNTAGVLRRPNSSIYLSAILAAIYYLVRIRQYPQEEGGHL